MRRDSVQEVQVLDSLLDSLSRQEATQSLLSNELESQAELLENLELDTQAQNVLVSSTHQNLLLVESEMNSSFDLFWVIIGLLMVLFGLLIFRLRTLNEKIQKRKMESQELAVYHYSNFNAFLSAKPLSAVLNHHAKNKLAKLTKSQFSELSTDVNDEIERRKMNTANHLPFINEYPIKRNQAREKLSTLNDKRFMDLAADVLAELIRRYPSCQNGSDKLERDKSPFLASKSADLAPRKKFDSIISIASRLDVPSKLKEYQSRMAEYQTQITDYELKNLELETQKLSLLKAENEKLKAELNTLKISEESTKEAHKEIESKYQVLEEQYQGLKEDYGNQEQLTLAIRAEANSLLEEVKNINSEKDKLLVSYNELNEEKNRNIQEIERLKKEYSQYSGSAKVIPEEDKDNGNESVETDSLQTDEDEKIQGKSLEITQDAENNLEAPTVEDTFTGKEANNSLPLKSPANVISPNKEAPKQEIQEEEENDQTRMPRFLDNTLIKKKPRVTYEEALQDLFLNAEMQESTGVLISMKEIVLACKSITEDASELEEKYSIENNVDLKADLSQALTKLMASAKDHAAKPSDESLKVLHSSSSKLTSVLENLVNLFVDLDNNSKYYQAPNSGNTSYLNEDYEYYDQSQSYSSEQLKEFLEEQADFLVRSIQTLLNTMREPGPYGDDFTEIIREIIAVVDGVIGTCRPSMLEMNDNPQLAETFEELYSVSRQLESFGSEMVGPAGQTDKQLKQKMASSSYEIAKIVKELLTFLES